MGIDIAVAHSGSPYISAYPWAPGFGAKYADPATLPPNTSRGVAFSPNGAQIAVAHLNSPYISAYQWAHVFGAKYADPATLPAGIGRSVSFSPNGAQIAVAHGTSPYISAYPWAPGFGAKYADPATLPPNTSFGVAFSPDGAQIAVGHSNRPYISAYPWAPGFGAKYADPATLPPNTSRGVAFSPNGAQIAVAHVASPYISVYQWGPGFGAKYANPATLPAGNANSVSFSPDGAQIAVAHLDSPYISAYPWAPGFGAKYANPATLPAGNANSVSFSPNGAQIAVAHDSSPYISAYPWAPGFGAKYADPATPPTGTGYGVAFAVVNIPPSVIAGPTVTYKHGSSTHEFSTPFTVVFTATAPEIDDPLGWEIWTGAGRTGTLVASGTCTSGIPASAIIPYDAPGLAVGVNTLYLTVDDGALVSDDVPFEILRRIGAQKTVALVWHTGGRVTKSLDLRWHTGGRAMRTVDLIWSVEPSERRLLRALTQSPVIIRPRFERRTIDNRFIEDVTRAVVAASIDMNNDRAIRWGARFTIDPTRAQIDPLTDHIAVFLDVLVDGNYTVSFQRGLYALTAPTYTHTREGTMWQVSASDVCIHLMESTTTETETIPAGTKYIDAVAQILTDAGLRYQLPASDAELQAPKVVPAGTPKLEMVNTLLQEAGFITAHALSNGVVTTRVSEELAARTPDIEYSDSNRFITGQIQQEDDWTRFANQVVLVVSNPSHEPMSAVATNADPDSPVSTVRLGRTITKRIDVDGAPSLQALQERARRELEAASSMYQRMTLITQVDPRCEPHQVYEVSIAGLYDRSRWFCRNWAMTVVQGNGQPPAEMRHQLSRVQRVVAS